MGSDSKNPLNGIVERTLVVLKKEYIVMGRERVSPVFAWLLIGLLAGITGAVGYVASRSGEIVSSEAAETDEIRIDYRYIRDFFTPQVTGFQFHKEIDGNTICSGDENDQFCDLKLCSSNGCVKPTSKFTMANNRFITFNVPKTTKAYTLSLIDTFRAAQNNVGWVLYKICPTDKSQRCNEKLRLTKGNMNSFNHTANQSQTIQVYGFDWDAPMANLTGKHSVKFSDGVATNGNPWLSLGYGIARALIAPSEHPTLAHLDIGPQMPANAIVAPDCKDTIVYHTNAPPGSTLAQKTDEVFDLLFNEALGGMFAYKVYHGSGLTESNIPLKFSGSGCTKNSRCGENGTNDIVFVSNPSTTFYKDLAQETGLGSLWGAALWYGVTGSTGNNDVAVLLTEMDIGLNIAGLDFNNPDSRKNFKVLLSHELAHLFVGRGGHNMLLFDIDGNPVIPANDGLITSSWPDWIVKKVQADTGVLPFNLIKSAYANRPIDDGKCDPVNLQIACTPATENCYSNQTACKALSSGGVVGDSCHPLISVEQ